MSTAIAPVGNHVLEKRLPSLDGLRGVSILLVIGAHAMRTAGFPESWRPVWSYLFNGSLGVRIFFVISGFLITWLLLKESERTGEISLRSFYARRVLRIFPVYFAYLLCIAGLTGAGYVYVAPVEWVTALTFTRNFFTGGTWVLGHLWSLSLEEQFYLLWPMLVVLLTNRKALWHAALLIMVLMPLVRVAVYVSPWRDLLPSAFFTQADTIMAGCLLALLIANGTYTSLLFSRVVNVRRWSAIAVIYLMWIFSANAIADIVTVPFAPTLQALAIAFLIGSLVIHQHGRSYTIINSRPLIWLGVLSYSLYLWQQLVLYPAEYAYGNIWPRTFPLNLLIVIGLALISYHVIEKPFLRIKTRFSRL